MMWLTWRQHRKLGLYTLLALAVLAAVLVPSGLAMRNTANHLGLTACLAKLGTAQLTAGDCHAMGQQFQNQYGALPFVGALFVFLPLLVGLMVGAPIVAREIEHGTHRLVWTQGIGRLRWALAKFGLLGVGSALAAAVYAQLVGWWYQPLLQNAGGRLSYVTFDVQGIAPIGYTVFAFFLGVCAGVLSRRMLPAMGITVGVFLAVRAVVEVVARPRYMSPVTINNPIDSNLQNNNSSGAWVTSQGVHNAAGQVVMSNGQIGCPPASAGAQAQQCLDQLQQQGYGQGPYTNFQTYQPGSRFWAFQGIETGIFVALAALLLVLAVQRLRRIA
ncbi:MAG: ABC transporter permease [Actinocrinis sp.]